MYTCELCNRKAEFIPVLVIRPKGLKGDPMYAVLHITICAEHMRTMLVQDMIGPKQREVFEKSLGYEISDTMGILYEVLQERVSI